MSDTLTIGMEVDYHAEELSTDPDLEVRVLEERPEALGPEDLAGVDVFISASSWIGAEALEGADDLQVIIRLGAGYDNVDVPACTERGIAVTHLPQGPTAPVAEMTVGLLLACANRLRAWDRAFRERGWDASGAFQAAELGRSTVGLVGMGRIGGRVLELLQPFGADLQVYDPYADEERAAELNAALVDLDDLLATADFVSIHVPLTDETEGMLGPAEFERMKETAYLLNTSRGGIYADADLAEALREGHIEGAAIDVFENESTIEGNPLLELDEAYTENCIFTPHCASQTAGRSERFFAITLDILEAVKAGEIPRNVLNPEAFDRRVPPEKRSPSFRPE